MNWGEDAIYENTKGTIFIGKFIGVAKRMNGDELGIIEISGGTIFMGKLSSIKKYNGEKVLPNDSSVVIKEYKKSPTDKLLPPLRSSKY